MQIKLRVLYFNGTSIYWNVCRWCGAMGKKVGIDKISRFSKEEKKYYTYLRNGCKLLDLGYKEFKEKLFNEFSASDKYYYENQSWIERNIIGYKNVGVDICNGCFLVGIQYCVGHILLLVLLEEM